jgi:hypothetical protein
MHAYMGDVDVLTGACHVMSCNGMAWIGMGAGSTEALGGKEGSQAVERGSGERERERERKAEAGYGG